MGNRKIRMSRQDQIFHIVNNSILFLLMLVILYPLYFIVIASFSDPYAVGQGKVWLFPVGITFEGYEKVFSNSSIWSGYINSFIYMGLGTFSNVCITVPAGYALSRKDMRGRKFVTLMMIFTMFFSGGVIPTFLLVQNLGIYDTIWAMVLPNAMNVMNVIICRTFFETTLPDNLLEAAFMDGCSDLRFFFRIALPLCKSVVMIMVLFYAVTHWNSYFDALIYLRDSSKYPLQIILRDILTSNEASALSGLNDDSQAKLQRVTELIKYSTIIFSNLPLLVLYPFIKKYFKKGVMIGAIKG